MSERSFCTVCGRPLKNPASVVAGVGPMCRAKSEPIGDDDWSRPAGSWSGPAFLAPQKWTHVHVTEADLPKGPCTKTYYGVRKNSCAKVEVRRPGEPAYRLPHVSYHSPDGFDWGYDGSSPADLARSILADCAGIRIADTLYRHFMCDFIVNLPGSSMPRASWWISEIDIRAWLQETIKEEAPAWLQETIKEEAPDDR
jgi:hypothetical protein